ncbi:hypothetical protein ATB99_00820 [Elizabethkingia meningoseptica]|nr:hypothetical protein BBD33_10300 [Elizabethkingia meningoseptica]AQX47656.1 hypothetical protein B5G46_10290 [Elizabethkingia meningoseptica]KUY24079.1 hypothetical protein ATB99_00820 [Elizabethkingia meningoseptica]OPB67720.1 hypothetical protein BAY30_10110 [Elizabethkingia meningoseptica]OPC22102.1 hypothetical protein BAX95_16045 [Elizabethkingia meningoseptica]
MIIFYLGNYTEKKNTGLKRPLPDPFILIWYSTCKTDVTSASSLRYKETSLKVFSGFVNL